MIKSLTLALLISFSAQALELVAKFTPSQAVSSGASKPLLLGHEKNLLMIHDLRSALLLYMYRVEQGIIKFEADLSIHLGEGQLKTCNLNRSSLAFDKYALICPEELLVFKRDAAGLWAMSSVALPATPLFDEVLVLKNSIVIKSSIGILMYNEQDGRFAEIKTSYSRIQRWGEDEILALKTDKTTGAFYLLTKDSFENKWSEKIALSHASLQNLNGKDVTVKTDKPHIVVGVNESHQAMIFPFRLDGSGPKFLPAITLSELTYGGSTRFELSGEKLFISKPYHTTDAQFRWTGMVAEFSLSGAQAKMVSSFEPGIHRRTEAAFGQSIALAGDYLFAVTQSFRSPLDPQIKAPAEIFALKP